jgi:hypothetical protein
MTMVPTILLLLSDGRTDGRSALDESGEGRKGETFNELEEGKGRVVVVVF